MLTVRFILFKFILFKFILIVSWITFVIFTVPACTKQPAPSAANDYARLCEIYREVMGESLSPAMTGVKISERVENEIPRIFVHFDNISRADANEAYGFFKHIAEKQTNNPWDCPAMEKYYSNKNNSIKDK